MPSPAPEPLAPRPLSIWLVDPLEALPGEAERPTRTCTLARILAARGHDVLWWSSTWSPRRRANRQIPPGFREDEGFGIRLVAVRPVDRSWSLDPRAGLHEFGHALERVASETVASGQLQRPDIVLATLPSIESAEACGRLARRLDATFVLDVVERWPDSQVCRLAGPAWIRSFVGWLALNAARRRRDALVATADAVVAADHTTLAALLPGQPATHHPPEETPAPGAAVLAAGQPKPATHVCHLGAYLEEFGEAARFVDEVPPVGAVPAAPTPPRAVQCVVTGPFDRCHDGDTILRAARLLSARGTGVVMHLVGTGDDGARVGRAAAAIEGSCRVVLHGPLPRGECVRLWAGCDVGIVSVRRDAAVAVPLEACDAAAAGLAIVHPLSGELANLVGRHEAGLSYAAGDATSLTDVIASLAADRKALAAMRAGARRLAAQAFDRERTYACFADWLETVPTATQPARA